MTREGRRGATNLRHFGWRLFAITATTAFVGAGVIPGCGNQPTDAGGESVQSADQALNVCVTIQRGTGGSVVEDAYVNSGFSSTNYGASGSMYAGKLGGGTVVTLLKFDLGGLPTGANITKADLTINEATNSLSSSVFIHHMTGKWGEATATWTNTIAAGIIAPVADLSFSNGATGFKGPITTSILPLVQNWYNNTYANNGVALKLTNVSLTTLNSSENPAALRPALKVCYDQAATCSNGVRDASETDVDCGGGACNKCADGKICLAGSDCASGGCVGGVCASPGCGDGVKNGLETDVDCGGGACPTCADGKTCAKGSDCVDKVCSLATNVCKAPTCIDGQQNGNETGSDCGGGACPTCANGIGCKVNGDCASGSCVALVCSAASCNDGLQNQGEAGVDCGGPCPACATCVDGIQNQGEAGVDCGGPCPACGTCMDGVQNQGETGVDCGGPCAACANCAGQEACNGLDDNCDGNVDEGNPGGGIPCNSGQPGVCGGGVTACQNGGIVCLRNLAPTPEVCNGLDDNCDGNVDEGNPGGGGACNTGGHGACAVGTVQCLNGALVCVGSPAGTDICDGLDNDCNGNVDNGLTDGFGHSCGAAVTYHIAPGGSGTFTGTTANGDDYIHVVFTSVPGPGGGYHPIITFTNNPNGNYRMQVLDSACANALCGNLDTWQMTYPQNPNNCQATGNCSDAVPKVTDVVIKVLRIAGGNDSCAGYTLTASN